MSTFGAIDWEESAIRGGDTPTVSPGFRRCCGGCSSGGRGDPSAGSFEVDAAQAISLEEARDRIVALLGGVAERNAGGCGCASAVGDDDPPDTSGTFDPPDPEEDHEPHGGSHPLPTAKCYRYRGYVSDEDWALMEGVGLAASDGPPSRGFGGGASTSSGSFGSATIEGGGAAEGLGFEPWLGVTVDPCDPKYSLDGLRYFAVCLPDTFTFDKAVEILRAELGVEGDGWVPTLLREITNRFSSDFDPDDTDLLSEDARWREWNVSATTTRGYAPRFSSAPRATLMNLTLRLISGIPEGIPVEYNGFAVRENVVPAIRDGEMRFKMYATHTGAGWPAALLELLAELAVLPVLLAAGGTSDGTLADVMLGASGTLLTFIERLEEDLVNLVVKPFLCTGASDFAVFSLPDMPAGMSTGACAACPDAAEVNLTSGGLFRYEFFGVRGADPNFPMGDQFHMGGNHGVFTRRVWVCDFEIDTHAVVVDWYLELATRHLARSLLPEVGPADRRRNAVAASFCVRMACSVAAELGRHMVHEVSHNVNLYHCADPWTFQSVGGLQDVAGNAWQVNVMAKLGLARFSVIDKNLAPFDDTPLPLVVSGREYGVAWDAPNVRAIVGLPLRFQVREAQPGAFVGFDPATDSWEYGDARLVAPGAIEFRQPGSAGQAAAIDSLVGVLVAGLAPVMPELATYLAAVLGQMMETGLLESAEGADLEFAIEAPLQMDSRVLSCCIRNVDPNCGLPGDTVDCWSSDAPDDAAGCCTAARATGGGGGGGGGGTALPPIIVIGVPNVPDWESDTVYVDGVQVA